MVNIPKQSVLPECVDSLCLSYFDIKMQAAKLCALQESGGTALSTNWKEVGAKTLQCEPPEGVKVKKFEY